MSVISPLVIESGRCRTLDNDDTLALPSNFGEEEIWSYDWTAQSSVSYTHAETATHNGLDWQAGIPSGSSVEITNGTGLIVSSGGSGEVYYNLTSPELQTLLGNSKWRGGGWAIMCQYTSVFPSTNYQYMSISTGWPNHWFCIARARNQDGQPNTSDGGITTGRAWAGSQYGQGYGASSSDIFCLHYVNQTSIHAYVGSYSSGWPLLEDMTHIAAMRVGHDGSTMQRLAPNPMSNLISTILVGPRSGAYITVMKHRIVLVHA